LPAEDSRIPVRPPFLAASDIQQEWRYTIPDEIKPDCIASRASRGLPIRRRTTTARPSFSPAADIIDVTGDDVPDRILPQYMDADQVLESYGGIDFVSAFHSLKGRAFTHVACEDLAVGNVVNSFNAGVFHLLRFKARFCQNLIFLRLEWRYNLRLFFQVFHIL
jgi:hypothetical protein